MLYDIEKKAKGTNLDAIGRARKLYSGNVLKHLRAWLDRALLAVTPKSMTGKAIHYLHTQWDYCSGNSSRLFDITV